MVVCVVFLHVASQPGYSLSFLGWSSQRLVIVVVLLVRPIAVVMLYLYGMFLCAVQARQLPLLAPVLPTKKPQLRQQTYEMVLQSLLADPAHHEDLLTLVQTWPNSLYPQTGEV